MKSNIHLVLKNTWEKRRKEDATLWSLRQIAKKLKISPGYLSKIFSGQKSLTEDLAENLIKILKTDSLGTKTIRNSFKKKSIKASIEKTEVLETYELNSTDSEWILQKWHRSVLLDLMTTTDFQSDPVWMAKRLGISVAEIENSLKILLESGLAFQDEAGKWRKSHSKMRFPTEVSKKVIRSHHQEQLKRALQELETRTTPKDYDNRLIVGLSIACNPSKLKAIKEFLHIALYEAAETLSEDPCTEVYQLNLQLFPQTKRS